LKFAAFIRKFVYFLSAVTLYCQRLKQRATLHDNAVIKRRGDVKMSEKSETILIGRKPAMNYVLAIVTGLSASDAKEITIKARGRAITTAVDVAEIVRNRFLKDLKVSKISIGTEEMPPREGQNRSRMVSTMEITLTK
jgi:DNA-binding protein